MVSILKGDVIINNQETIETLKELNNNYFSDGFDEANEAIAVAIITLHQQLNNKWIPVGEKLPTSDGRFEVTIKGSKGKRRTEMLNFYINANEGRGKWGDRWDTTNVLAWRERSKPYDGK